MALFDKLSGSLPAPTVIDRLVSYISPERGVARLRARAMLSLFGTGGYKGASTEGRPLRNWKPGACSPDGDTIPDLPMLRARSRDLARNAPLATGALNTNLSTIVGTGLVPHAQVDREFLGLSDEQADDWERQAERIWTTWANGPGCDITRRQLFAGMQILALRATLESGDVFVVRRFLEQKGDLLGLKLQLVEADRVSNPQLQPNTDLMREGVELDKNGAPLRYHVMNRHPGEFSFRGGFSWNAIPAFGESGEPQVLHIFEQLRPDQTRGVPYFAPVIETLKQLDQYTEAELQAAVVSAFFTVFIEQPAGVGTSGLAPVDPNDPNPPADHEYKLGPAAILDLAPGEKAAFADPKRPNDKFDAFVRAVLNQVGVALDLPFELLIKHFTSSYSASRAALLEAWRAVSRRRFWLASRLCQPTYAWVITEAVARGMIDAPGFFDDPIMRQAWLGTQWVGPSMGQLDPMSEVEAAKLRVDEGFSTRAEETAQLTGGDFERKHRQRVKEEKMRQADGLAATAPRPERRPTPVEREEMAGAAT